LTYLLHDELARQNVIAEAYWRLHSQPASEWSPEAVFDGN
jgi:hypothetical protein